MSKFIDITNETFGKWKVLKRDESKKGTAYWICKCECGTIRSVCSTSLRKGLSNSCGCDKAKKARKNNGKFIDETGNTYGKLTVLYQDEELSYQKHRAQWVCECECGNIITTSSKCLREGKTQSCGCMVSIGESNIQRILAQNNIKFTPQFLIRLDNKNYYFDFAILNEKNSIIFFIEFDGIQHIDNTHKHWGKTAMEIQERDCIKNKYCLDNNIPLYRIPYEYRDKITLKLLTDEKFRVKEVDHYGLDKEDPSNAEI